MYDILIRLFLRVCMIFPKLFFYVGYLTGVIICM